MDILIHFRTCQIHQVSSFSFFMTIRMEQRPIRYPYIYYMNLRNSIITDGRHCKKKARRLYVDEHDTHKGLKNIVHAIRYVLLLATWYIPVRFYYYGMQLLEFGRIVDFTAGNNIHELVFNSKFDDWNVSSLFSDPYSLEIWKWSDRAIVSRTLWQIFKHASKMGSAEAKCKYFTEWYAKFRWDFTLCSFYNRLLCCHWSRRILQA